MVITTVEVEALKELRSAEEVAGLPAGGARGITLPAVIDLVCWMKRSRLPVGVEDWIRSQTAALPALREAMCLMDCGQIELDPAFNPRTIELAAVKSGFARSTGFYFLQERFRGAARLNGFGSSVAFALAGVLQELVDNVEQHSVLPGVQASGVVGYHAQRGRVTFSVGDCGCGVLASLRSNPDWATLRDSAAALTAIIRQHASRRVGFGEGEGIKQLFKSLVDLNGWIRFRSGDAFVELRGNGHVREETTGIAIASAGLQISVTCSPNAIGFGEEEMAIDNLT